MRNGRLALLALAALIAAAVGAASAQARPVVHKNHQAREQVVRYWTPARMREAIPVERSNAPTPKAKPGTGGGGTGATSTEVPRPYPSAHGKVFFTDNRVNYVCSGTALVSSNSSLVWTAGHCVNEGPGNFYTNFLFVPAYRDGLAPYGRFAGSTLLTTSGWQANGEFGVDVGSAVVGTNVVGSVPEPGCRGTLHRLQRGAQPERQAYGYPAARKFNGQRMRVCDTSLWGNDTSTTPDTMGVVCDMTGGSSGGGLGHFVGSRGIGRQLRVLKPEERPLRPAPGNQAQQLYLTAQGQ